MRFALLALGTCGLLAGCSSSSGEAESAVAADDLVAMATPGVDESALDRSVDPCSDFFEFACGGYDRAHPDGGLYPERSFLELNATQDAILTQVVAEMIAEPLSPAETKASVYYATCLAGDPAAKSEATFAGFRAEMESLRSKTELVAALGRAQRAGKLRTLFSLVPSPGRTSAPELTPWRASDFAYYVDADNDDSTTEWNIDTVLRAEPSMSKDRAAALVASAARAAKVFLDVLQPIDDAGSDDAVHLLGQSGLASAAPTFDWTTFFDAFGAKLPDDLGSTHLDDLAGMARAFEQVDLADLAALLTLDFDSTWVPFPGVATATAKSCRTELVSEMSDVLEPRFLELAGVDSRARTKARALFDAIAQTFGEELREAPFLDVPTRAEALAKLAAVRTAVGESGVRDDFADLDLDGVQGHIDLRMRLAKWALDRFLAGFGRTPTVGENVGLPVSSVNASYAPSANQINVPGGILGGFFFSPSAAKYANFAGIGTVLGHELTHGFDSKGRNYDANGNLRNWWTPATSDAFDARAQCMVDEYSAFTFDGATDPTTNEPLHEDGRKTLGENIADNGGLRTAFRASKVKTMAEPVVAGLSPAQQFFVGYAQLYCGSVSSSSLYARTLTDVHSLPKARVNVPLSNFDEFQTAFQCRSGAKMVPDNRCVVW